MTGVENQSPVAHTQKNLDGRKRSFSKLAAAKLNVIVGTLAGNNAPLASVGRCDFYYLTHHLMVMLPAACGKPPPAVNKHPELLP